MLLPFRLELRAEQLIAHLLIQQLLITSDNAMQYLVEVDCASEATCSAFIVYLDGVHVEMGVCAPL